MSNLNNIGKKVTLSEQSEYYCGEYISGRFYYGVFGGTGKDKHGIYYIVDGVKITISDKTSIKFDN